MTTKTITYIRNMLIDNLKKACYEANRATEAFNKAERDGADNVLKLREIHIERQNKLDAAGRALREFEAHQW